MLREIERKVLFFVWIFCKSRLIYAYINIINDFFFQSKIITIKSIGYASMASSLTVDRAVGPITSRSKLIVMIVFLCVHFHNNYYLKALVLQALLLML